jgi:hypothetical protein
MLMNVRPFHKSLATPLQAGDNYVFTESGFYILGASNHSILTTHYSPLTYN